MGRYRLVPATTTVGAAVADGYQELETLKTELEEVIDEASGSNRENTTRIQTLTETKEALDNASVDSPPDIPSEVAELEVRYMENKVIRGRYGKSREIRRDDALAMIMGAKESLETHLGADTAISEDDRVALTEIVDTLQSIEDDLSGCEFPGMYG